jgi:ABC-type polysaccharide/polyol phosphate export permease
MTTAGVSLPIQEFQRKPRMRSDLRDLRRYRSLIWQLVSSGLQTERTGTVFGFVWWLLDPILLMFVYYFLFSVVFHRNEPYYPIYILISLVAWEFFLKSVERSIGTMIGSAELRRQVRFPKSVIPISTTLTEFSHLLFGLVVSIFVAWIGWGVEPTWRLVGLIPLAVVQGIFTLGFALLMSGANFFFRDIQHLLRYVMRAWYLTSPGLFSLSRIPEQWQNIYQLNPYAPFFETYHSLILGTAMPPTWALVYVVALSISLLVGSYALFVRWSPKFVRLVD